MKIKTLPTICCFIDGSLCDKVIGFDDLGGVDDFKTGMLAMRLARAGVIPDPATKKKKYRLRGRSSETAKAHRG
eukprot:TRINITY_DN35_c0_g1_i5.p3 TRINITY_DN35_c0_g1~~TRINITY_DN35_c0_g1_i5.p3  ORF type:complete len:74 (+),score=27.12 TRINITY_DN35_c0_g1_i5:45-266(+)